MRMPSTTLKELKKWVSEDSGVGHGGAEEPQYEGKDA